MFFASSKFPFFVSKRYLVGRKSQSAINIITLISILGVTFGTMALVVVLSVFNGFDDLIKSLFNSFDPEIKITLVEGKAFTPDSIKYKQIKSLVGVAGVAEVLEENTLIIYRDKQYIATIKGVTDNFQAVSDVNKHMVDGKYQLSNRGASFAVIGQGLAYYLGIDITLGNQLELFVPRRGAEISYVPEEAFNKKYITPIGVFSIEQDVDSKYIIIPIHFARKLLEYENEVTALEIKVKNGYAVDDVKAQIASIVGKDYQVKDRYQQQELFYKIMKSEKWAIFFILTFILIVASLNIISSLTMLILDKKKDIKILSHMGANWMTIRKVFLFNGWASTVLGAIIGTLLGLLICWIQIHFGVVKLEGSGSFVIDTYPVRIATMDILLVLITVLFIGFITSWIPVRVISKKYFE